jgi:hypothetical protein
MDMERRELFRVIGIAAVSAGQRAGAAQAPRFFSETEYQFLESLCEAILPADEEGGGAIEAGVPRYIDTLVFHAEAATKDFWRSGLAAAGESRRATAREIVERLAKGEHAPATEAERFFVRLKAVTIDAFFQSQTGMDYVGYKGNTGVMRFPGCTHEHGEA